jgi:hypothetical protein
MRVHLKNERVISRKNWKPSHASRKNTHTDYVIVNPRERVFYGPTKQFTHTHSFRIHLSIVDRTPKSSSLSGYSYPIDNRTERI